MILRFLKEKADRLIAGTLFAGALFLYWRTLAPSVAAIFDDSLEFQLVTYQLGIAHPTGYPLYTILGKLFTLLPLGDVAYRVNLMSAIFAAATIAALYLTTRQITPHRLAAVLTAATFVVSPLFWSQAVIAEVYTLNALFVALTLYWLLRWEVGSREQATVRNDALLPAAFIYGLSLTHHRTMLFLAPAIVLFVWLRDRRWLTEVRLLSKALLLFLAPLLLYLYLPIRGLYTSSLNGAYQNTLPGFIRYVTTGPYTIFLTENPLAQKRELSFYPTLLLNQFGLVGSALGLLGALRLRKSRVCLLLSLTFLTYLLFAVGYQVSDIQVFLIPAFLIYALWIGAGLDLPFQRLSRLAPPRLSPFAVVCLLLALIILLPLSLLRDNYHAVDLSHRWAVHDYGLDMLSQPLEEGATVIGILGEMTLLHYFQETQGLRPDLVTVAADLEAERLAAVEEAMRAGCHVYLTRPLPGVEERYHLSALGPLIKVKDAPLTEPPSVQHPLDQDFGPAIRLVGYDIALRQQPEQQVARLTLYWQAKARPDADLKVSAKLFHPEGHLVGQKDQVPVHNAYPTTAWRPGEVVTDLLDVPILAGVPPGDYRLEVSMYLPTIIEVTGRADLGLVPLAETRAAPPPSSWDVQSKISLDLGHRVRLLGYSLTDESLQPGHKVPLVLLWQALAETDEDYILALWLQDESGALWGRSEQPLGGSYLTSRWRRGQVVRDWPSLTVPATVPDGRYRVKAQVLRQGEPLTVRRWFIPFGQELDLGAIQVKGRERLFEAPAIKHPFEARLGDKVKLLGYDLHPTLLSPGEPLHLTLYWQALAEMDVSYTVFTHLVDEGEDIWGQQDSLPGGGSLPTMGWIEGEIIVDEYHIVVDPAAPPGDYALRIGMYDPTTGQRLSAFDAQREPLGDDVLLLENVCITNP